MKLIKISIFLFPFLMLSLPTIAGVNSSGCIATSGGYIPCSSASTDNNNSWQARCGTSNNFNVKGVAICGQSGSSGNTSSTITLGGSGCWCKIVYPFITKYWIYASPLSSGECSSNCASWCADSIRSSNAFRQAVAGNLSL